MGEVQPTDILENQQTTVAATGVPFRKGFDPRRRAGSPSLGRQITSYWNLLGEEDEDGHARYTEADLKAIAKDPKAPHAKVVAAQDLLRARMEGFDKLDRVPKAADSLNRILDRTEGKPRVVMEVTHTQRSTGDLRAELVALYDEHPQLLEKPAVSVSILVEARKSSDFRDLIRPILQRHRPQLLESLDEGVLDQVIEEDTHASGADDVGEAQEG